MKRRAKRTYIDCDLDDLIEQTRSQLSLNAAQVGIKKDYTRIETTKLLALQFKEFQARKQKERERYNGTKMWNF